MSARARAAPERSGRALRARALPDGAVAEIEARAYLRVDGLGRWVALAAGALRLRRAADGNVLRSRPHGWDVLDDDASRRAHALAGRLARRLARRLRGSPRAGDDVTGERASAEAAFTAAADWTSPRLEGERRRAAAAWPEPVPILPPHRYRDLVVMPATGCPHRACTFCFFYRDRPFRALDAAGFDRHLAAVVAVTGGLAGHDGVFLGSASALSLPDDVLLARMARVREVLGAPRRGFASFYDADRGPRRTRDAWERLREAGLVDATIGLETGDPDLRAASGKAADLARLAAIVADMKAARLGVALTVLVGLGGAERARAHRERTTAYLATLPLDGRDLVYLSPWTEGDAALTDPTALAGWRDALTGATVAGVRPYLVERFAWLA
ncbi:MAG TPA: radical SAM protein [Planctomycetota bacterium]|nr:radical SAM protein [Planctomycetota bacterium]